MTTPANDTALLALQGAVLARLLADLDLAELVGDRVYDEVPEGTPKPYISIGDAVETPDNELAAFGSRVAHSLHVWSAYGGYAESLGIVARLMRLLDHQPLTVPGRGVVAVRHEQTVTMRDPDPDVRHVVVRFAFDTYPTS